MNQSIRVLETYRAHYADPIEISADAVIELTGRTDLWRGHRWLWAKAPDGREGWVPDSLVDLDQGPRCKAKFDYSAAELSCEAGEILTRFAATHGWSWCANGQGSEGWVPDQNLQQI